MESKAQSKFMIPFIAIALFALKPVVCQQQQQTNSAPLTCYQQITAPSGYSNISFQSGIQNNQYQQPQQTYANMSMATCSATTTSCFKFVCAGVSNYTIKNCLDGQQFSCQTLQAQCPGNQGLCLTCNSNNCNGASEMTKNLLMTIFGATFAVFALVWKF